MSLMGLDLGTSGCKSVVYSADGKYLGGAYREYSAQRADGVHELDASVMWDCIRAVILEGADACRQNSKDTVEAIIVSSFGEAGVPLDAEDQPLHGVVLYTDNRGVAETERLCACVGRENIMREVYMKPHSMYTLPKLMWYKEVLPDIYQRMKRFLLIEDYAVYMLTGTAQVSYSCAARTMMFDVVNKHWSSLLLDGAGIDRSLLSEPVPSGTSAGKVHSSLCEELHLSPDTVVLNGAHDQIAAATGGGALTAGTSIDGMGTVDCIVPVFDQPFDDAYLLERGYVCAPHSINGRYATNAFCYCGGALLQWFRNQIARDVKLKAEQQGVSAYQLLDERVSGKPTGILVMPHFAGAATPYMDTETHSAIFGMSLETTQADFYQAMMEGVSYEMLLNLEMLREHGVPVHALNATGGGSRSKVWMQMKADIIGLPVHTLKNPEAGAVGCIMLGAVAKGYYNDLTEAASVLVQQKDTFLPNNDKHAVYQEYYEKYKRIYQATKDVYGLANPYAETKQEG